MNPDCSDNVMVSHDEEEFIGKINRLKSDIYKKAKSNIDTAQIKQKQYYDNKRRRQTVC